jgi:G6PDH family F420-dependent oxidoreductase
VLVSAFGPLAADLAAERADGFVSTSPDQEMVERYRAQGGEGPCLATIKVCWGPDEEAARKEAHRLWASSGVPGQSSQELSMPAHFEEAADLVTPEQLAEKIPCGPDPERHLEQIRSYIDAGFDEIHLSQVGDDQAGFFRFFTAELAPRL